jgi:serine/threonine protein phosphatase PrpC
MTTNPERYKLSQPLYDVAAATSEGRVRNANEDAYGLSREDGIFLVCDGMGGAAAGEVASGITVEAVLKHFVGWQDTAAHESPEEALREAILSANLDVFNRAAKDSRLHGMGTTLVCIALAAHSAWVAHVGDSRCYRLRDDVLEQVTLDHSLVEEQVRMGSITEDEAARSPLRNVITRAVGSTRSITADVAQLVLQPNDLFLLCSDGLTRELNSDQMTKILVAEADLQKACAKLIEAANKSGGHDNITCLLLRIQG